MDLLESLTRIGERAKAIGDKLETEEATKTALVLPFISALGYDFHDPTEVIPEFTADVGHKKGEKVDYAVLSEGHVVFLIECKKFGSDLQNYTGQLFRYFTTTEAKVGILTDGVTYKFYSDLEEPNKLDSAPFYTLNITDLKDTVIRDLPKITKEHLDPDGLLLMAQDLKYISEIKNILRAELRNPTWLCNEIISYTSYKGKRTKSVVNWFSDLTTKAAIRIENNYIRERLNLSGSITPAETQEVIRIDEEVRDEVHESGIETTLEEHEGYHYIKSVLSDVVDSNRVTMRDTNSYCGILLDDNNRKPICRLHFNNPNRKSISFGRDTARTKIENVIDILNFRAEIVDHSELHASI